MWRRFVDRLNHEYWPWQIIHLPVWPLYFYEAIRQRRAVFFTNVNPAIDMGGFFGERKTDIYSSLPPDSYPTTVVVPPGTSGANALLIHRASGIAFPLIVKPDVGERGDGVVRVADEAALMRAITDRPACMLVQAMAMGPEEFGLMFAKDPTTGRTKLLSVCGKRFLAVKGDGTSTIGELLARSWRGQKQVERLGGSDAERLLMVPEKDAEVMVEPIGNHCRGTIFNDANHLATPALRDALDRLLARTQGIHYGRFDVRSDSDQALREGRFTVIELNGVSSEPGHIYDPAYTIFQCWAELVRHVRHIGPISRQLHRAGHPPVTLHALVQRCEAHLGWRLGALRRLSAVFA